MRKTSKITMATAITLLMVSSAYATLTGDYASYDASLGTLPDAQGWTAGAGGAGSMAGDVLHLEEKQYCWILVVLLKSQVHRFIEKTFHHHPLVTNRHFKKMTVRRESDSPIQIDGEVFDGGTLIEVDVLPSALNVIVPQQSS